nr:DnaJ domain-containing protein [Bradyrhizobium sp. CCBAU 53340]
MLRPLVYWTYSWAPNLSIIYETLEISPNANSGTIERMFHYLAQRYHPDNRKTERSFS